MCPASPMSCYWMASAGFEPLLVIAGISLDSSVCPHSVLMLPPTHTVHMVNHTRDSQPHGKTYSILLRCVAKVVLPWTGKLIHEGTTCWTTRIKYVGLRQ